MTINRILFLPGMRVPRLRSDYLLAVVFLLSFGCLLACGQTTDTKTVSVPIDTTVVDDDTLEVSDTSRTKQTEHAR